MTRHIPKLFVLLAMFVVAPVSAERLANSHRHSTDCPSARAKAQAAATAAGRSAPAKPGPTTITLIDPVPSGSLLGHGAHRITP
jgi:hypothetical protein